jgi:hypothetical protein
MPAIGAAQKRQGATHDWLGRRERELKGTVVELGHHRTRCGTIAAYLAQPWRSQISAASGTTRSAAYFRCATIKHNQ